jgi:hypothetical protein
MSVAKKTTKRGTAGAKRAAGSTPAPRSTKKPASGLSVTGKPPRGHAEGTSSKNAPQEARVGGRSGGKRQAAAAAPKAGKTRKRALPPAEAVALVAEAADMLQREAAAQATSRSETEQTPQQKLEALGVDALCQRLRGGQTLTAIAVDMDIGKTTLLDWLAADPDRSARAREARSAAAVMFDEQADQLLEGARDYFELAKAKERAQHLRWRASKVNPTAYGDKVQVDANLNSRGMTDEQLQAELAKLGIVATVGPKPEGEAPGA